MSKGYVFFYDAIRQPTGFDRGASIRTLWYFLLRFVLAAQD